MAEPSSPRETSKRETRRALVEAALAEFAEKGLDGPSLDAICARAGFTRGAFYVHFAGREELLAAAMERALGLLLDAVTAGDEGSEELAGIVDRYVALAASRLRDLDGGEPAAAPRAGRIPLHQLMAACQRHEATRDRMVEILREGQRRVGKAAREGQGAGRVREDVEAGDVATLLVLLALGVRAAADLAMPLHVERTRDALLRLLAPPPRRGTTRE